MRRAPRGLKISGLSILCSIISCRLRWCYQSQSDKASGQTSVYPASVFSKLSSLNDFKLSFQDPFSSVCLLHVESNWCYVTRSHDPFSQLRMKNESAVVLGCSSFRADLQKVSSFQYRAQKNKDMTFSSQKVNCVSQTLVWSVCPLDLNILLLSNMIRSKYLVPTSSTVVWNCKVWVFINESLCSK